MSRKFCVYCLPRWPRSALGSRHLLAHDEGRIENLSDTRLNTHGKEKREGRGVIALKKSGLVMCFTQGLFVINENRKLKADIIIMRESFRELR
jgi:hypothetical protein